MLWSYAPATLFRLDPASATLWDFVLDDGPLDERPRAIEVDGTGATVIPFSRYDGPGSTRPAVGHGLLRLDPAGSVAWRLDFADHGIDVASEPVDVAVTADGRATVLLTRHLVRVGMDGTVTWIRELPRGELRQVFALPGDGVLAVGATEDAFDAGAGLQLAAFPGRKNTFFARYDTGGNLVDTRSILARDLEVAALDDGSLAVFSPTDGRAYFGSPGATGNFPAGPFVAMLDPEGRLLFSHELWEDPEGGGLVRPFEIRAFAPDGLGGLFVGGVNLDPYSGYLARIPPG
jgi:hypothetical protein